MTSLGGFPSYTRYVSPLRYPGGKARMAPFLGEMFWVQSSLLDVEVLVEPFAGGAGAGLTLLAADVIDSLWIGERHPALAAFWRSVIADAGRVADIVADLTPGIDLYRSSLDVLSALDDGATVSDVEAGVAAFVVNRCSHSGIVHPRSGPTGGWQQQGRWTVASRFDPAALSERIGALAPLTHSMLFCGPSAVEIIDGLDGSGVEHEVLLLVAPPYIGQGNRLYRYGMTGEEHAALSRSLNATSARWVLTYDDHPDVPETLYPQRRVLGFTTAYTTTGRKRCSEYAVFSANAVAPQADVPVMLNGKSWWVRNVDAEWDEHDGA